MLLGSWHELQGYVSCVLSWACVGKDDKERGVNSVTAKNRDGLAFRELKIAAPSNADHVGALINCRAI